MAKKTYIAQNEICGLEPPSKTKDGTLVEHVVQAGGEVSLDDEAAAPLVAAGALKLKGAKSEAAE